MTIVKVDSAKELSQLLAKASKQMFKEIAKDITPMCLDLETDIRQLTPYDTGFLRNQNEVEVTSTQYSVKVHISNNAEYAEIQHEGYYRHNPPGQRKFIEQPFMEYRPRILEQASNTVERLLTEKE